MGPGNARSRYKVRRNRDGITGRIDPNNGHKFFYHNIKALIAISNINRTSLSDPIEHSDDHARFFTYWLFRIIRVFMVIHPPDHPNADKKN
jgi:hypothetical protein